jgi:TonB family protein
MDSFIPVGTRLSICILLAFVFHIFLYTALMSFWPSAPKRDLTIPVVMLTESTRGSIASERSVQSAPDNEEILTTISESEVLANTAKQRTNNNQTSKATKQQKLYQQQRQQKAGRNLKELFSNQRVTETQAEVKQLSTKNTQELSEYQQTLIRHMVRAELYDQFHQYLINKEEQRIDYEIELRLMNNGAIRSARIVSSSGFTKLDELAITTAYNASPYPRPPRKDATKGYRYTIPVGYQKK